MASLVDPANQQGSEILVCDPRLRISSDHVSIQRLGIANTALRLHVSIPSVDEEAADSKDAPQRHHGSRADDGTGGNRHDDADAREILKMIGDIGRNEMDRHRRTRALGTASRRRTGIPQEDLAVRRATMANAAR